jgi:AcrR family transcriptional regulator
MSVLIDKCQLLIYFRNMSKLLLQPRPTRGHHTRTRLAEVALAEFRKVGVNRASIGEIAMKAGVSRPAFYFHFPTKAHILLELQRSLEMPMAAEVAACSSLEETLAVFVKGLMRSRRQVGSNELFSEMLLIYTRNSGEISLDDQPLMDTLANQFRRASESNQLRSGIGPEQATLLFLTSIFGYFIGRGNLCTDRECEFALKNVAYLFLNQ